MNLVILSQSLLKETFFCVLSGKFRFKISAVGLFYHDHYHDICYFKLLPETITQIIHLLL